ncbi:ComEC/Rec2 family competence protein, partial [Oliverpabstia sp. DFI.9.49]|nr:ComEC/Rec2 family competence protein [Oliverpabstia sp. DFI.9.49]
IIGLNTFKTTQLLSSVKKLGVIHLFCISGMHVVLLIAILRGLLIRLRFNIETIDWLLIALLPFYLIIGGGA